MAAGQGRDRRRQGMSNPPGRIHSRQVQAGRKGMAEVNDREGRHRKQNNKGRSLREWHVDRRREKCQRLRQAGKGMGEGEEGEYNGGRRREVAGR